jgi:flagellar export protein FliJ
VSATEKDKAHKLRTLVRLHELQLEQARVEHAAIEAEVERQRARVQALEITLANSHTRAQEMVSQHAGVCAEELKRLHDYAKWHAETLSEQRAVLERSRGLAEEARAQVIRRFERLSVMERLSDQQARDAALSLTRREQKRLDEQAPVRKIHSDRALV